MAVRSKEGTSLLDNSSATALTSLHRLSKPALCVFFIMIVTQMFYFVYLHVLVVAVFIIDYSSVCGCVCVLCVECGLSERVGSFWAKCFFSFSFLQVVDFSQHRNLVTMQRMNNNSASTTLTINTRWHKTLAPWFGRHSGQVVLQPL